MGTAFGQVVDYLFAGTNTAGTTLLAGLQTVDPNVELADNLFSGQLNAGAASAVSIGRNQFDTAIASSARVYLVMGAYRIEETFDVPIQIRVRLGGPQMKPARDIAVGLFDQVAHFVAADLTLGGALQQGRSAVISDYTIDQTNDADDAIAGMNTCIVQVTLTCKNMYTP